MKRILPAILLFSLSFQSLGTTTPTCPLENVQYNTLKEAVYKLSQNVNLPQGCEAAEQDLKDAAESLSLSTDQLSELAASEDEQLELEVGRLRANEAINSLNTINKVFSSECGETLRTAADYTEAFIDTLLGVGPLMLLFGGPEATTFVFGVNLFGSVIKTALSFFRSGQVNMKDINTRNSFIKNSCTFHTINENIRSLQQALEYEETEIQKRLFLLEKELAALNEDAPKKPENAFLDLQSQTDENERKLQSIRKSIETFNNPRFTCRLIRNYVENDFAKKYAEGLSVLLTSSNIHDRFFLDFFSTEVNVLENFPVEDEKKCSSSVNEWLQSLDDMHGLTKTYLSKKISDVANIQGYLAWQKQVKEVEGKIKMLVLRQKFLNELVQNGAQIELSEILDTRDYVEKSLFRDPSWRKDGPAMSWVDHKLDKSHDALKSFHKKYKILEDAMDDVQNGVTTKANLSKAKEINFCNLAQSAWEEWITARTHANATSHFCEVFEDTIQRVDHKSLYNICYTSSEVELECYRRATAQRHRPAEERCVEKFDNTVPGQVIEVLSHSSKKDRLENFIEKLECKKPKKLKDVI